MTSQTILSLYAVVVTTAASFFPRLADCIRSDEAAIKKTPAKTIVSAGVTLQVIVMEPPIIFLRWAMTYRLNGHHSCFVLLLIPTSQAGLS